MNEQIRERIERIADEIHDEISDILPDSVWDNCRVGREVMKQIHEAVLKQLSALTAFAEEEQKDTERLDALIEITSRGGSSDFTQLLFFASKETTDTCQAFRNALDQWIASRS